MKCRNKNIAIIIIIIMGYYGRQRYYDVIGGCVTIAKCCDEKSYLEISTKTQGQSISQGQRPPQIKFWLPVSCFILTNRLFPSKGVAVDIHFINLNSSSQYLFGFYLRPQRVCSLLLLTLQMSPERTWVRAGKVALVAFVWLFSSVCFQMSPQMACLRRGKVT